MAKVFKDPESGHWFWLASHSGSGGHYGQFNGEGAHRWSYRHFVGPIPDDMTVDHKCFVTLCVNPDHLRLLTGPDNTKAWAATITHCKRGHEFTAENTLSDTDGWRRCVLCRRASSQATYVRTHVPKPRSIGVRRPGAKLTDDDVRAIRLSAESNKALAARYGVAQPTISMIRTRKKWKHVA